MAGDEFLDHARKNLIASKSLQYSYLNAHGQEELEIVLALLFKERHIKHSPLMVSVASLLLLFMKPSEVYHILQHLLQTSQDAWFNPEQRDHIRWHLTLEKGHYFKLLNTFIKSYLKTTLRGKRSVLQHMGKIGFDFSKYVDVAFKTLLTSFVSLPIAIDILCMYLVEGVKVLFRFTYAVMKCNKAFIKKCNNPAELIDALKAESKEKTLP